MQRARTHYKFVLCLGHRRVADLQRYAPIERQRSVAVAAWVP
jgi:hypothetical protein